MTSDLPTYSGGLGVLAGDTLRSAADLGIPMVAVSLLYRAGHFDQVLTTGGRQAEPPVSWNVHDFLTPVDVRVSVDVEGREVALCAWRYDVTGVDGHVVPVYLIDADQEGNDPADRKLTGMLYGGDDRYRLGQEVLLGIGGVRLLRALGYTNITRFHLNEGHAAFAILELLEEEAASHGTASTLSARLARVRPRCVFTTHTPIPAGHDAFEVGLAAEVLGPARMCVLAELCEAGPVNMTRVALAGSSYVNAVAMRHAEVSRRMFPGRVIHSITNGIHSATWVDPAFAKLFDRHLPGWTRNPASLRHAAGIATSEIRVAHLEAKERLLDAVRKVTDASLDKAVLTIGFARRATAYKRASLIFSDLERLRAIAAAHGPLQFVFSGKAHPKDRGGKAMIARVFRAARALRGAISVVYVPNYSMTWGRLVCAGVDLWLNTPVSPLEASGTSGMKAALNGVPSLSILDGWWVEGHVEGVTGWAVGSDVAPGGLALAEQRRRDAAALYETLETTVVPCFYRTPERYTQIARSAIAINASHFNTHRMALEYYYAAYQGGERATPSLERRGPGGTDSELSRVRRAAG